MSSERLPDVAATHAHAAAVARSCGPGDVIALVGDLGAGKTEWTRGLAAALRVPPEVPISSPSYLLLNVYRGGRLPLAHFDAYFMAEADDLERAGFLDLAREGALIVVEWADRVSEALPDDTLWLHLQSGEGPTERRLLSGAAARPQPDAGPPPCTEGLA